MSDVATCLALPHIPFPTLPSPFSISASTPPVNLDAKLCCRIAAFEVPPVPVAIALPPGAIEVVAQALAAADEAVNAYKDLIPFNCPRE